jgi:ABC-type Zn uptake system ZnuABC Zn-binding protein ZnuA
VRAAARCTLLAVSLLALAACGRSADDESGNRVRVVATTTQVADLTRNVGGARVEVTSLLRPNADPHDYEPRPSDVAAVERARLVLRSGGEVDAWLSDVTEGAGGNARQVDLGRRIPGAGSDPHWWQDPRNAERGVGEIRDALVRADPDGRREYERRAQAYTDRLRTLDAAIASCMARVPADRRKLVTTHDALAYYARRYGIRVIGFAIPSRSTEAEPSAGETARLVEQMRREKVRAIFPETSLNPKLERAIAREAGVRVGKALYADSLGPRGSAGATYLGSLVANTRAIVEGFGTSAAPCSLPG